MLYACVKRNWYNYPVRLHMCFMFRLCPFQQVLCGLRARQARTNECIGAFNRSQWCTQTRLALQAQKLTTSLSTTSISASKRRQISFQFYSNMNLRILFIWDWFIKISTAAGYSNLSISTFCVCEFVFVFNSIYHYCINKRLLKTIIFVYCRHLLTHIQTSTLERYIDFLQVFNFCLQLYRCCSAIIF